MLYPHQWSENLFLPRCVVRISGSRDAALIRLIINNRHNCQQQYTGTMSDDTTELDRFPDFTPISGFSGSTVLLLNSEGGLWGLNLFFCMFVCRALSSALAIVLHLPHTLAPDLQASE